MHARLDRKGSTFRYEELIPWQGFLGETKGEIEGERARERSGSFCFADLVSLALVRELIRRACIKVVDHLFSPVCATLSMFMLLSGD